MRAALEEGGVSFFEDHRKVESRSGARLEYLARILNNGGPVGDWTQVRGWKSSYRLQTRPCRCGIREAYLLMYPIALSSRLPAATALSQTDDAPVASFLFGNMPKGELSVGQKGTKKVKN